MLLIAMVSAVAIFILLVGFIGYFTQDKANVNQRMVKYATIMDELPNKKTTGISEYMQKTLHLIQHLGLKLRSMKLAKKLESKMQQAGFPLHGSEFMVIVIGIAMMTILFTLILTGSFARAFILGVFIGTVCFVYLNIKIDKRKQAFHNQLGDALAMMANALRAGFSFMPTVDVVAKEMKPPIAVEFGKVVREIRLGATTEVALNNLSQRVGSDDLDLMITAVLIQRQVGGNLAQIFDSISATINARIKMKREIRTLTAQSRASGWIIGLLPIVLGLLLYVINPEYMEPLFKETLGQILIIAGLVSQFIGMLIIRKIINIDV